MLNPSTLQRIAFVFLMTICQLVYIGITFDNNGMTILCLTLKLNQYANG
jgi:hypothetical protein